MKATLEMALEALTNPSVIAVQHAIELIKAELAKPEQAEKQEPVAWMLPEYGDVLPASQADGTGIYNIPLYTAPPRKEWVGLTDKEIADFSNWLSCMNLVKAIEAKLKELNT